MKGYFMKVMTAEEIKKTLGELCQQILNKNKDLHNLRIVGIQRRGAVLARRMSKIIHDLTGKNIPVGSLDITLYRDDLSRISYQPILRNTDIPFSIDDKYLLLVDDVLYTGRTIRAALDALLDLGRPGKIELVVLIDRGHRELPVQADYVGRKVSTSSSQMVELRVKEIDGKEEVIIFERS